MLLVALHIQCNGKFLHKYSINQLKSKGHSHLNQLDESLSHFKVAGSNCMPPILFSKQTLKTLIARSPICVCTVCLCPVK